MSKCKFNEKEKEKVNLNVEVNCCFEFDHASNKKGIIATLKTLSSYQCLLDLANYLEKN